MGERCNRLIKVGTDSGGTLGMEKLTTKGFGNQGLVYGRRGFTLTLRQWVCTHGDAISSGLGCRDHTEGLRKLA